MKNDLLDNKPDRLADSNATFKFYSIVGHVKNKHLRVLYDILKRAC